MGKDLSIENSFPFVKTRKYWQDVVIVILLFFLGGVLTYQGSKMMGSSAILYDNGKPWSGNAFFEADPSRVFDMMTSRSSQAHYRNKVHPLFSLVSFPPVFFLSKILKFEPLEAVRIYISFISALWLSTFFVVLRLVGCRKIDSALFSLVGSASSAAMFFSIIPETHIFGSLSILLALGLVAWNQHREISPFYYVIMSGITMSFTITNWMAGIFATVVSYGWKKSTQITINAFVIVTILWGTQKVIFPHSEFFLGDREEGGYINILNTMRGKTDFSGGPLRSIVSFIFHSMVMPAIEVIDKFHIPESPIMRTQISTPGSASLWGLCAVGFWSVLLILGVWSLFSLKTHKKFRLVLGLTILGQFLLFAVYGDETFLYSLGFAPLLIILTALGVFTKLRPHVLALATLLLLSAAVNNTLQLKEANGFFLNHGTPRNIVQAHMHARPLDPWPRGTGHVVLSIPGSIEENKAYHEPGGSFSPSVGSFGVSIWILDSAGKVKLTSDSMPLEEIRQKFIYNLEKPLPDLNTKTPFYEIYWSLKKTNQWDLEFKTTSNDDNASALMIRSVGPAGGAVQYLKWDNKLLVINNRWAIAFDPVPKRIYLGEEGAKEWMSEQSNLSSWENQNGWGYVRIPIESPFIKMEIKDTSLLSEDVKSFINSKSSLVLDLPDPRFQDCLKAQIAHILMGTVNNQLRPGEPTNYPLPWQRDGAYALVALARAGQKEIAKKLSIYFAENDFFGGFGPETDAPGLSVWALNEVADQLNDPEYDARVWPHIQRKVNLILEMLSAKKNIYHPVTAPTVDQIKEKKYSEVTSIASPSQDGLISGRVDFHNPFLYINGVSYRGLLDAASMAIRLNQEKLAQNWISKAQILQHAWKTAFGKKRDDYVFMSGLWPTWVAAPISSKFEEALETHWEKIHNSKGEFNSPPLWTYFDLAEAHQWLLLGKPEKVWDTLNWFWSHQASPGLFTWWEGNGEENTSGRWKYVRGWVNPPFVTPHYWTAAEMLLLQLDMLAYLDESTSETNLVIGMGIPKEWINHRMEVNGIIIRGFQINWQWDGSNTLKIQLKGGKAKIILGPAFPENTKVLIS